jgi:hypothetical protein
MIATLPMDDELDLVGYDVGHNLFDQQAEYLLARFSARPNTVPSRWKIPSEFKEPFAIFRSDYDNRLSVALSELLFQRAHIGQPFVPTSFQFASNQSVVGINFVVLTMRACSLEPRLLKRILKLSPFL